jgi:hypothetical protein
LNILNIVIEVCQNIINLDDGFKWRYEDETTILEERWNPYIHKVAKSTSIQAETNNYIHYSGM